MAQYQAAPTPPATDPGRILGIVGLILAIIPCTWFIGVILSVIGFIQSRKVGIKNNVALAGIIVGAVWLVIDIILNVTGALSGIISNMTGR
jgi:high-affinity K+ transport system ATPase subunit B